MPRAAGPAMLFFHSPCFDGVVSAVLALDFLETSLGWKGTKLQPIDYAVRDKWLELDLPEQAAVVDFLYHPQATFWADHHPTAFLTPAAEADFLRRHLEMVVYDRSAPSCSQVLWQWLGTKGHRNSRYEELVSWANTTDSAQYPSVEQALNGRAAAFRINNSLGVGESGLYSAFLVRQLRQKSLNAVASLPQVRVRHAKYVAGLKRNLANVAKTIRLVDGVAVYEARVADRSFPRYAPYHFYPEARYSIGLLRRKDAATVSAMRNPWREFPSQHLGQIFEPYGGGGHQRVASVVLRGAKAKDAERVRDEIANRLRANVPARRRMAVAESRR